VAGIKYSTTFIKGAIYGGFYGLPCISIAPFSHFPVAGVTALKKERLAV